MAAADDFEFAAWGGEYELEQETMDLLTKKGFKSYKSLARLSDEILKKEFQKAISPGQFVLLQGGVEILRPPPPAPKEPIADQQEANDGQPPHQSTASTAPTTSSITTTTASATGGTRTTASTATGQPYAPPPGFPPQPTGQQLSPSDLLAMWHQAGDLQPVTQLIEGNGPDDPFGFGTGPYSSSKCRQVAEYVTHMYNIDSDLDQESTVNIGGLEFSLAKGKKVAQDKIRYQLFMEGSLRILRELIVEESLNTTQTVNHINYLIQIACLAQTNPWKKVKDYDVIYRREQQKHGFAWGKSSPFLLQSQLGNHDNPPPTQFQSKKGSAPGQAGKRPPLPSVRNPSTGQTICNNFNGRNGCSWPNCHFSHVCKSCYSPAHSEIQHRENSTIATTQPKN